MDSRSRLAVRSAAVSNVEELTPQERLQRLVQAIEAEPDRAEDLAWDLVEQGQFTATPALSSAESDTQGSGPWRKLGRFLVLVISAVSVGTVLETLSLPYIHRATLSDSLDRTASALPAPQPVLKFQLALPTNLVEPVFSEAAAEVDDIKAERGKSVPDRRIPGTPPVDNPPSSQSAPVNQNKAGPLTPTKAIAPASGIGPAHQGAGNLRPGQQGNKTGGVDGG